MWCEKVNVGIVGGRAGVGIKVRHSCVRNSAQGSRSLRLILSCCGEHLSCRGWPLHSVLIKILTTTLCWVDITLLDVFYFGGFCDATVRVFLSTQPNNSLIYGGQWRVLGGGHAGSNTNHLTLRYFLI